MCCEPTTADVTAEQLAHIFHRTVFRYHGVPRFLVSDRDTKFTSDFWRSFAALLGTKLQMSTANHPQTDGLSERYNRTLEDMLRAFVGPHQDDWCTKLVSMEFAYNDSVNETTGFAPYQLCYGRNPRTPLAMLADTTEGLPTTASESAADFFRRLRLDRAQAADAMGKAQARQTAHANARRRPEQFHVGDMVMLSTDHVRQPHTQHARAKLRPRFTGPFKVTQVVNPSAYRLEFPEGFAGIHDVINIGFLKRYRDGSAAFPHRPEYQGPPEPDVVDGQQHWHVEAFRGHRYRYRKLHFTVKWTGQPECNNVVLPAWALKEDMTADAYNGLLASYLDRLTAAGEGLPGPDELPLPRRPRRRR